MKSMSHNALRVSTGGCQLLKMLKYFLSFFSSLAIVLLVISPHVSIGKEKICCNLFSVKLWLKSTVEIEMNQKHSTSR